MKLLEVLLEDEKKIDKSLYSSGPYWDYKNKRTVSELKKKGLSDFRGLTSGIGTSFTDKLTLDIRNELNLKGKIVSSFFSLPFVNTIFKFQIALTKKHLDNHLKNLEIIYKNDLSVQNLIKKYKFSETTKFGCLQKFKYFEKEYSIHYLNMAHRIENLSKKFDFNKVNFFFEIGGGLEPIFIFY